MIPISIVDALAVTYNTQLKDRIHRIEEDNDELRAFGARLVYQVKDLLEQRDELQSEVINFKEKINQLDDENNHLVRIIKNETKATDRYYKQVCDMENENKQLKEEIEANNKQLKEKEEEIARLTEENGKLEYDVYGTAFGYNALKIQLISAEVENEKLREQVQDLSLQLDGMKKLEDAKHCFYQSRIADIIQSKDTKIAELCRKIVDLWKENKELKERNEFTFGYVIGHSVLTGK